MFKFILLSFLLFYGLYGQAQYNDTLSAKYSIFEILQQTDAYNGYVNIKGDPAIQELVDFHLSINKKQKNIVGYRIQIFSGSSYDYTITRLQTMKEEFSREFPDIPVYLNYYDPDFKIRAGNFRNRLDCIPTLKRIRKKYPSSYPVKTNIPFNDLLKAAQAQKDMPETTD